ncbi:MAG TPA: hypothetical protein VFS20_28495 [Longimicrobium sp.]|nr:hypothetical protein [Longimicrobium sp.]
MMERRRRSRWLLLPLLALAACSRREGPASEAQIARVTLNTGYEVKSAHAVRTDQKDEAYYVTAIISRPEPRGDTAVTFLMVGPKDAPRYVMIASSVPEGALR